VIQLERNAILARLAVKKTSVRVAVRVQTNRCHKRGA
jgi:hypothetical protein